MQACLLGGGNLVHPDHHAGVRVWHEDAHNVHFVYQAHCTLGMFPRSRYKHESLTASENMKKLRDSYDQFLQPKHPLPAESAAGYHGGGIECA